MANGIDVSGLTDEQFQALLSSGAAPNDGGAGASPSGVAGGPGGVDVSAMSEAEFQSLLKRQRPPQEMGTGEAAARLFYKHLTFGTEPGVDKHKTEQAERDHPVLNYASAVPAFVAQTAVLGPAAAYGKAVQGANALARTARFAGSAVETALLPNTAAKGLIPTAVTGAKLGGNYSALEALGSGLTNPDKTLGETARDTAISYGLGTVAGGTLGAGAYGVGKAVGAVANRTMPQLREALEAARSPENQGIRDLIRHAGYDDADLAALKATLDRAATDPAIAARYADLNLIEALKAGRLKPTSTGELKPEVITTRNLDDLAKHAANTEGAGQNRAAEAFATRKNEMSAKMQADIDQFFGTANREADAAAISARRDAVGKRYNKLRDSGTLVKVDDLGKMQQVSPVFDKALRYAGENDAIANPGSQWGSLWSGGKLGDTVVTLSPSNMLDIHHYLVMNAKPSVGRDPAEALMAGRLKNWFTDWADRNFGKHRALRQEYTHLRRVMDATEKGADLPISLGGKDHEAMQFFRQKSSLLRKAEDIQTRTATAYALAAQNGATQKSLSAYKGRLTAAQRAVERQREVVDEFIKARGESIKQALREKGDNGPSQITKALTTEEGKRRLLEILGPEKGRAYIEALYNKANQQRLGNTLYGNSDTAFKLQKKEGRDALWRMASGVMHFRPSEVWRGAGDMLSSAYRQRNADRLNDLFARQGPGEVSNILQSALAMQSLQKTGDPLIRNPLLRTVGPVGVFDDVAARKKERR